MKSSFFFSTFILLWVQNWSHAQDSQGSLSDISFIEGHWKEVSDDKTTEAIWSPPSGDNLVGMVRVMKDGKATLYEFFAFEQTENGLFALVKHFKPGLIGLEEKEDSDRYRFLKSSAGRAIFEKEGEDIRILYEKRSNQELAIAVGTRTDGKWTFEDFWLFKEE